MQRHRLVQTDISFHIRCWCLKVLLWWYTYSVGDTRPSGSRVDTIIITIYQKATTTDVDLCGWYWPNIYGWLLDCLHICVCFFVFVCRWYKCRRIYTTVLCSWHKIKLEYNMLEYDKRSLFHNLRRMTVGLHKDIR